MKRSERFDLYSREWKKTGETMQRGTKVPKGYCRLVVHVCIFNEKGEMLIQKRQPFKDGWPGYWDLSAGGSAIAGESSFEAISREALEEVGFQMPKESVPALTTHFRGGFDEIYTAVTDMELSAFLLQEEEVECVKWATEEEVLSLIDKDRFIPYHKPLISYLFYMRNHRGSRLR